MAAALVAFVAGLAEVEVYGDPVGLSGGRPPLFVSGPLADSGRYYAPPGGELALTAVARDPDGGGLTYSWEARHGTFVGSGGRATYRAPSIGGVQDLVTVRVSDGVDPPTAGTLAIDVLEGVPNGLPVLQDAGPEGLVSMEAAFRRPARTTCGSGASARPPATIPSTWA